METGGQGRSADCGGKAVTAGQERVAECGSAVSGTGEKVRGHLVALCL